MSDFKAVSFLIFISLVMAGAVFFVKNQTNILDSVVAIMSGIILLSIFAKVVTK